MGWKFELLKRAAARGGFALVRAGDAPGVRFAARDREMFDAVRRYTMTSIERVVALRDAVEHVASAGIPGALVECGVWRGGSSMVVARTLVAVGAADRDLYLFDTFAGMTPPTEKDRHKGGMLASELLASTDRDHPNWAVARLDEVRRNMARTGYPADRVRYVEGRVEDTVPAQAPEAIALLRLDTDWYESTYHELVHLFPRLSPGGILIIDDYGCFAGAREATDRYFAEAGIRPFLFRIDADAVCCEKPAVMPAAMQTAPTNGLPD